MPNGIDLTADEFEELDGFVRPLDDAIAAFANRIGGSILMHYHGAPNRHVLFTSVHDLEGIIIVSARYLDSRNRMTPFCTVDACAR